MTHMREWMRLSESAEPSQIVLAEFQAWLAAHRQAAVLTHVDVRVHGPQEVFLHGFQVRPQGQGLGTKIIQVLQTLCRKHGVAIMLEASAEDAFEPDTEGEPTEEQSRLEGWYLRLGFEYTDTTGAYGPLMRWTPEPTRLTEAASRFRYVGNCTMQTCAPYLADMMEQAKTVPYRELLAAVGRDALAHEFPQFYWGGRPNRKRGNMALHQDYAVSFYKSTYRGMPCYFVQESGIEHIFVSTEYDRVDWSDPSRQKSAKRFYISDDGSIKQSLADVGSVVISVVIAGRRFKAIQSSRVTPAVATAMLGLIQQYQPSKVREGDDADDEVPVAEYEAWLRSHL